MMYRRFIATILATAVAITGLTAAPARAGNDDFVKLLAGVAAVAIIGTAIAKKKRRDDADDYVARQTYGYDDRRHNSHRRYHKKHGHSHGHNNDHFRDYGYGHNTHAQPIPRRVQRKLLPGNCRLQARNRRGEHFKAFGGRCLKNNFEYAHALPAQCAVRARPKRGGKPRLMYRTGCLRDYGYRVSRR